MRTHPATIVSHGEMTAEIDVELVPLILEIWRAGIGTIHSCQDVGENVAGLVGSHPHLADLVRRETGRGSIGFPDAAALEAFLAALAGAGPCDGFYERMVDWAAPAAWQLVLGLQAREEQASPKVASFQVRFPATDVGEMTERMRRHNRHRGATAR